MELKTLIDTVHEDLDACLRAVSLDDAGGLRLQIEYDSLLLPEGLQRFELRCLQPKEFNVAVGHFGSINQSKDHVLLLDHQGPQSQLFFSSAPASPEQVFYIAHAVLSKELRGWRDPATYLNGSPEVLRGHLTGGYGLLAHGPHVAMEAVAAAVSPLLTVRTVASHSLPGTKMVLTLDRKFVICESVEVLPGDH
ncbi:hypothetical protein [Roseateles chitinivorans]|uniref:hypothetical protein n=1 Tax=Roseateles chitinivorans TaxID=2917965 RepID=UPI003D669BAC